MEKYKISFLSPMSLFANEKTIWLQDMYLLVNQNVINQYFGLKMFIVTEDKKYLKKYFRYL